jgi:hypothetical protein
MYFYAFPDPFFDSNYSYFDDAYHTNMILPSRAKKRTFAATNDQFLVADIRFLIQAAPMNFRKSR